jgi:hypothetical protein
MFIRALSIRISPPFDRQTEQCHQRQIHGKELYGIALSMISLNVVRALLAPRSLRAACQMSCSSPHTPLVLVQSSRRRGSPGPQQASTTEQNDFSSLWWDGPRGPKARLGPARDGVVPCRHAWLMCRFCAVAAYRCRISPVNLWCGRSRLRGGGGGARSLLAGDVDTTQVGGAERNGKPAPTCCRARGLVAAARTQGDHRRT